MSLLGRPTGSKNSSTASKSRSKQKGAGSTGASPTEYHCTRCGSPFAKQKDSFFASWSPLFSGNNNRLPVCRKCIDELYWEYTDQLGSEEAAIRRICMKFDIYYNESILNSSKKYSAGQSRISSYIRQTNLAQNKDRTYDTTLEEEITGTINSMEDLEEIKEIDGVKVTATSIRVWGFGLVPQDYEFLNNQFADWKAKCIIDGKARETLVRELCMLKLQQNKALIANDVKTYKELTEQFQKTLERANLSPKQEDANDKALEKPIGMMIDMFENDRPIPEPDEEWRDVDGIIKLVTVYFIGHLCKMLGLKNKYSQMYEDEMNRYRVTIPELEEAEPDDVFDYLMENGFDQTSTESDVASDGR